VLGRVCLSRHSLTLSNDKTVTHNLGTRGTACGRGCLQQTAGLRTGGGSLAGSPAAWRHVHPAAAPRLKEAPPVAAAAVAAALYTLLCHCLAALLAAAAVAVLVRHLAAAIFVLAHHLAAAVAVAAAVADPAQTLGAAVHAKAVQPNDSAAAVHAQAAAAAAAAALLGHAPWA